MHQRCAWLHYVTDLLNFKHIYQINGYLINVSIFDIKKHRPCPRALRQISVCKSLTECRAGDDLLRACHALVTHRAYKGGACCRPWQRSHNQVRTMAKDFSLMEDSNRSSNPSIHDVSAPSRRTLLRGGLGALAGNFLAPLSTVAGAAALVGCATPGSGAGPCWASRA